MITLLHMSWRGGSPHIVMYSPSMEIAMELPISKERAQKLLAMGCQRGDG
jgi:hypothetical protein